MAYVKDEVEEDKEANEDNGCKNECPGTISDGDINDECGDTNEEFGNADEEGGENPHNNERHEYLISLLSAIEEEDL
jgi:hypothetical protein